MPRQPGNRMLNKLRPCFGIFRFCMWAVCRFDIATGNEFGWRFPNTRQIPHKYVAQSSFHFPAQKNSVIISSSCAFAYFPFTEFICSAVQSSNDFGPPQTFRDDDACPERRAVAQMLHRILTTAKDLHRRTHPIGPRTCSTLACAEV